MCKESGCAELEQQADGPARGGAGWGRASWTAGRGAGVGRGRTGSIGIVCSTESSERSITALTLSTCEQGACCAGQRRLSRRQGEFERLRRHLLLRDRTLGLDLLVGIEHALLVVDPHAQLVVPADRERPVRGREAAE